MILSALSTLLPFVLGVWIERTFGLLSGEQFVILFSGCIFVSFLVGFFVHSSWMAKGLWCIFLCFLYFLEFILFAVIAVMSGGFEAT